MRAGKWLAAAVLGLGLAGSAPAQSVNFDSFGSNWAGGMVNQPVNLSGSIVPIASPQYRPASTISSLLSYMPSTSSMTNTPVYGVSIFPTPSQMPGTQYLQAFNYYRPQQTLGLFSWLWPFGWSQQWGWHR